MYRLLRLPKLIAGKDLSYISARNAKMALEMLADKYGVRHANYTEYFDLILSESPSYIRNIDSIDINANFYLSLRGLGNFDATVVIIMLLRSGLKLTLIRMSNLRDIINIGRIFSQLSYTFGDYEKFVTAGYRSDVLLPYMNSLPIPVFDAINNERKTFSEQLDKGMGRAISSIRIDEKEATLLSKLK